MAPIERAASDVVAAAAGHPGVTIALLRDWGCEGLVFTTQSADQLPALAGAVAAATERLYAESVPFNIFVGGPTTVTVLPRQNEAAQLRTAGFRMAVAEVVGCVGRAPESHSSRIPPYTLLYSPPRNACPCAAHAVLHGRGSVDDADGSASCALLSGRFGV